jgi:hypothetical protein
MFSKLTTFATLYSQRLKPSGYQKTTSILGILNCAFRARCSNQPHGGWRLSLRWQLFVISVFSVLFLSGCFNSDRPVIVITATPSPDAVNVIQSQPAFATNTPLALNGNATVAPIITQIVTATPAQTNTPFPYPWTDENAVMSGICFEAANDSALSRTVFVLRSAEEHIRFYGLADESQLCRQPVIRNPFEFAGGRVLAGLWSRGTGCTARHDVLGIDRDDDIKQLLIRLRFVTEGDCNYELVRPFWIGLDGVLDYEIDIEVS